MTEASSTDIPDINTVLPEMLPSLRQATMTGWGLMAVIAVAAAPLAWLSLRIEEDGWWWAIMVIMTAFFLAAATATHVRRRHEAQLMPLLAKAAGLDYDQSGYGFLDSLPPRLLPKGGRRNCEDVLWGKIGGRDIRFAEVKIETGGKNSQTLFRGIVAEFPNILPMPAFFVADQKETEGWFGFSGRIKIDDLSYIRHLNGGSGTAYGVWASSDENAEKPGFAAVLEALTGLEHKVGGDAKLYTAASDGTRMWVALRYGHDLFRIGGMFGGQDKLTADIRRAYDDLTLPMRIVSALLEAEGAVAKGRAAETASEG